MEESEKLQNALASFVRNTLIDSSMILTFISVIQKYSIASLGYEDITDKLETEIHNIEASGVSEGDNILSELYLHIVANGVDVNKLKETYFMSHTVSSIHPEGYIKSKTKGKIIIAAIAIKLFNNILLLEIKNKG